MRIRFMIGRCKRLDKYEFSGASRTRKHLTKALYLDLHPGGRWHDEGVTEGASAYTVYPYKIKRYWLLLLSENIFKRFEISLC